MADFPTDWPRGDYPRNKYDGVLPDQDQKEKVNKQVFALFGKSETLINKLVR